MRIIICGSRHWTDTTVIAREIDRLYTRYRDALVIIHGAARGADALAAAYATRQGITVEAYPADWSKGKAAGPHRNQHMLDTGIDGVVAFDMGGTGTADMMRRAKAAGVPVIRYTTPPQAFYRIDWPQGVFGIAVEHGIVTDTAPMGKWARGKAWNVVEQWYKNRGATILQLD